MEFKVGNTYTYFLESTMLKLANELEELGYKAERGSHIAGCTKVYTVKITGYK